MSILGQIVSIARYPVKSMSGELLAREYLAPYGLERDRLYAFESSSAPAGMFRLTAPERRQMLQYHPHVRTDGGVEVLTPDGSEFTSILQHCFITCRRVLPTWAGSPCRRV